MTEQIGAKELQLDTRTEKGLFGWFLASLLFGRPVSQKLAALSWQRFIDDGWTTPQHFVGTEAHDLWNELWRANYHRLGSVMHEELGAAMSFLIEQHHGSALSLVTSSPTAAELSTHMQTVKGIGPKTAEIFLQEVPMDLIGTAVTTIAS
jgi:hypothetical protein